MPDIETSVRLASSLIQRSALGCARYDSAVYQQQCISISAVYPSLVEQNVWRCNPSKHAASLPLPVPLIASLNSNFTSSLTPAEGHRKIC